MRGKQCQQGFAGEYIGKLSKAASVLSSDGVRFPATVAVFVLAARATAAQLEVISFTSAKLRGNPLHDPVTRRVAIFKTETVKDAPLVVYLPGWGGSSEDAIAEGPAGWMGQVVDRLAARGMPFRIAVVDGRSRYGGSQFLNSSATGEYADYIADEIVPLLAGAGERTCVIAGHSSGGYGALMLAISRHEKFSAVVALSPDSAFETTHKPLVEDPSVRAVTRAQLDAAMAPAKPAFIPASLFLGLCANYAPTAGKPGRFEWLYDDRGQWRVETWERWIALDPLTVVRKNPNAFAPTQRVYLDGAEYDEFGANIGARKIHETIREKIPRSTFYESPGHHADRLAERLVRGLAWISGERD